MKIPNQAIKRERYVTPTIDEIITALNKAKVFSKLDLNDGYHQLELDEESRAITTFSTHEGLFRYKRLSFGVCSAAEVFQNAIRTVLSGIQNVINVSDDILIFGEDQKQHDTALHQVLHRCEEAGLTLNKKKCSFSQNELTFFGYKFSSKGVEVDPQKVEAFKVLRAPENQSETRSLLGMIQYCGKFIPNLSEITKPIRDLTKKDTVWTWNSKCENAFLQLKKLLINSSILAYFDILKDTIVTVDAGPHGIAGILAQREKGKPDQIIAYASRSLTEVETRYSQFEKETLAIVWALETFHIYLFGTQVIIYTDHQPLVNILKNPRSLTSARVERLRLRMAPYLFTIIHKKGTENPSDYMSRHPLPLAHTGYRTAKVPEEYVQMLINESVPKALRLKDIGEAVKADTNLQKLIEALKARLPNKEIKKQPVLKMYSKIWQELTIGKKEGNTIILRGTKILIPDSLQETVIQLAHRGHQGVVRTKQLLRQKVWFLQLDSKVEKVIKTCLSCQIVAPIKRRDPIQPTKLPENAWENIAIDFAGPYPNGKYLVIVTDEFSRYPLAEIIPSVKANTVIPYLRSMFSQFGIPKKIKSDNGPPFNGRDFMNFAQELNFIHHRITPRWPEANGQAERCVQTLKKITQTAVVENKDLKVELEMFLMNYRATPHPMTGQPPYNLLFGRQMNTTLPSCEENSQNIDLAKVRERDSMQKQKAKLSEDQKRKTKPHEFHLEDIVLVKREKQNKLTPAYYRNPLEVINIKGTQIMAYSKILGTVTRNSSSFKKIPNTLAANTEKESERSRKMKGEEEIEPSMTQENGIKSKERKDSQ